MICDSANFPADDNRNLKKTFDFVRKEEGTTVKTWVQLGMTISCWI
jgi:hypothetical protein